MGFVFTIIITMFLADLWWWYFADRAARRAKLGVGHRVVVGITMGITIVGLALLLLARILRLEAMVMPEIAVILTFVWHFMVLPLVLIPSLATAVVSSVVGLVRRLTGSSGLADQPASVDSAETASESATEGANELRMNRRAFLARVAVAAPPVAALALTGRSVQSLDDLTLRRETVLMPNLPPTLEGLRIAHVSDPHVGSFMSDEKFRRIIEMTNELDADLVLQTGDLINASLKDLPDGIQMLQRFRGRYGVYSCQGNHDCIESRDRFESDTRRADVGMLLDETRTIVVNGQKISLIAPRWRGRDDAVIAWSVERLVENRPSDAWAIVLAHHPHAFDAAARAGIPLTLAGHTHGGQLALSRNIGFGPLMYRYWHGLYRNGSSVANISAGMGNWFPLRLGMPCEIVELTLRRA